jgi:hypothetical protein
MLGSIGNTSSAILHKGYKFALTEGGKFLLGSPGNISSEQRDLFVPQLGWLIASREDKIRIWNEAKRNEAKRFPTTIFKLENFYQSSYLYLLHHPVLGEIFLLWTQHETGEYISIIKCFEKGFY